jgi:hypothetical protein
VLEDSRSRCYDYRSTMSLQIENQTHAELKVCKTNRHARELRWRNNCYHFVWHCEIVKLKGQDDLVIKVELDRLVNCHDKSSMFSNNFAKVELNSSFAISCQFRTVS